MTRLLIQFHDEELSGFRWASFDESSPSAEIDWQSCGEAELGGVVAKNALPVVIIIPQQSVYLTQVEMPEKASRQLLSAIEYQVEDQLAQDIETQHFALGNSSENPVAIAVVSKSIMQRCLMLAQGHGMRLIQIVPELFLCPWQDESVALTEGYDGCLLRYGKYRGLKCNAQALPAMLKLVKRDSEFDKIIYYGGEADLTPRLEGYELERQSLSATTSGLVDAPLIDLQQRDFQMSSAWQGLYKAWKWVALLVLALLVLGGYNKAVALQELENELSEIKQQQFLLLKSYLPKGSGVDDNLKKLLIERMKQLQSNQQEQGFMQLLLDFTRARQKYPEIRISRIGFQGKRLSFDISSSSLSDLEALQEKLRAEGIRAKLENLNIKPEQTAGRLVLEGGGDV